MPLTQARVMGACEAKLAGGALGDFVALMEEYLEEADLQNSMLNVDHDDDAIFAWVNKKVTARASLAAAQPGSNSLGMLVELQQQLAQQQQQLAPLSCIASAMLDILVYDEGNATAISVPAFKNTLVAAYSRRVFDYPNRELVYCMLSHKYLPKKLVIGAHLWKRQWARLLTIPGITDINDVRNGLLLSKPIEWAFDTSRLSFIQTGGFGPFQAIIIDPSIKDVPLVEKLEQLITVQVAPEELAVVKEAWTRADGSRITFGDLEASSLKSDGPQPPNPFSRVLYFQYKRSLQKAQAEGWMAPEVVEEMMSKATCGSQGAWRANIEYFFSRMEAAEGGSSSGGEDQDQDQFS
mmetsp:Transcript_20318/g.51455  ORF Transcript_20318/g.51455 Transcript_20318/m.51455 type:complete len:351 (-) Transcript_20318:575-1627(-)|eukprot:CAMPEP_0202865734 /NCGR_PEP_ID=MMETSP1391-20130828/6325_1 /ASSEMBLY_ACC=CAM_ASM_000867 /TAXON_ID=1034604 /ORGANISM="Chlamydomonas leiostraca, Strain SAG 11-49" /LENGTH=350 /DNA_ID=CAMNT_0049545611 /DNA_START=141 /DNA_END=1193 /DNA_ORIENTATION=-